MDLISIVLPVYNGEKYLRESIDSILAQTYTNWELLIMDDCSSDQTPNIAKEYAERDPRIRYYRNEQNLRLPRNLNRGFSLARGDYLTWTSDDNRYLPTALEKMLHALQNSKDAEFAFASCRIIDGDGKEIEYIMVGEFSKKVIVGGNSVGACFLYTRKVYETIGEYDANLELAEDFDYWQRVFARFETVALPEILYQYRLHDGALTSKLKKEKLNATLEKTVLKNRELFGRLDWEQAFHYYNGLSKYRKEQAKENEDADRLRRYAFLYLLLRRLPNKIQRTFRRSRLTEADAAQEKPA